MSDNIPSAESKNTDQLVFSANKIVQQQLVIGILLVIMGFIATALTGATGGVFISAGVLSIIISFTINGSDYVTLDTDCIGMKMGFRARVNVLFSEIISVERASRKITIFYKIHGEENSTQKKLVISLNIMDDKDAFLDAFTQRTGK